MFYQPVVMVDTFSLIFPSGVFLHTSTIERLTSIHGAPFRKKLITFLRTKIFFWCSIILLLSTWNTFLWCIKFFFVDIKQFYVQHQHVFVDNKLLLCRVKLFVSTQNYFPCNTNFREFHIFWRKIKIISISMWTLAPP